jgi:hypothetical protein
MHSIYQNKESEHMIKKTLALAILAIGLMAASNPPLAGPNNGQITVANSSTSITPVVFPTRYQITFANPAAAGGITIYICQATQMSGGFISPTLKTCSSSVADIILPPQGSFSTTPNGYTGQYTAITSSSTQTLIINEN